MSNELDALSNNNRAPNPYWADQMQKQADVDNKWRKAYRRKKIIRTILGVLVAVYFIIGMSSFITAIWTDDIFFIKIVATVICIETMIAVGWATWEHLK